MSALQTPADYSQPDATHCKRCGTPFPARAAFCGTCGERITRQTKETPDTNDVAERYRVMSLVRRRTYVQVFLAMDNLQQKPVVICDIDISSLDDDKRTEAIKATQHEYDLLRRYRTPDIMPVIDLRYFQGHLFTIAGWPFSEEPDLQTTIHTLQDLLQSGIGLPDEQTAIAWMYRLCLAVNSLHRQFIVIGDLDPNTILVSNERYNGAPALVVGWLPLPLRGLLPPETLTGPQHFTAPEVLSGTVDTGSDIYSLGAILYLLLTGIAPEEPERRRQQTLHSPRELNSHVSVRLAEVTMRALAMQADVRFDNAKDLAAALLDSSSSAKRAIEANGSNKGKQEPTNKPPEKLVHLLPSPSVDNTPEEPSEDAEEVTISVAPIQAQLARWYMSKMSTGTLTSSAESESETAEDAYRQDIAEQKTSIFSLSGTQEDVPALLTQTQPETAGPEPLPEPVPRPTQTSEQDAQELTLAQRLKKRFTGGLPAVPHLTRTPTALAPKQSDDDLDARAQALQAQALKESFLKRLQRFILGEQQRSTTAAALIETPLRIQPNQGYSLRIHLMGRDTPFLPAGVKKGTTAAGLSGLIHGEKVHVEVRSSLYQNYAYIVQRADVEIPARGYAAEVTIPMQALTTGPSGRRERLHIFFLDAERRPLYEKPFVLELFISHLVQSGREGHNVLNIPI
jgi:serine/threonine protein kinase